MVSSNIIHFLSLTPILYISDNRKMPSDPFWSY